jgi:hypothetical protein
MTSDFVIRNWGPLTASVILLAVFLNILFQKYRRSPSGELRHALSELRARVAESRRAEIGATRAEANLDRLLQKREHARPSHLLEVKEALQDARALQKIAEDRRLVAENHVRRIILEEFPPVRHERLRAKYLPAAAPDKRPFSF